MTIVAPPLVPAEPGLPLQQPVPRSAVHIPALDGLRGLAILLVLAAHFAGPERYTKSGLIYSRLVGAGWTGVDLFFVLSGFLITGILYDSKEGPDYFRNFYIRRALRIFPLYYGMLFCYFILVPHLKHNISPGYRQILSIQPWCWLYGTNILMAIRNAWCFDATGVHLGHFWSLAVEEHFYLVWPVLVFTLRRRMMMWVCAAAIVFALAFRVAIWWAGVPALASYVATPCRIDALAMGGLIALLSRNPRQGLHRYRGVVLHGTLILGVVLVMMLLWMRGLWWEHPVVRTVGFTIIAAFYACFLSLIVLAPSGTVLASCFSNQAMRTLGRYSYGLYVLHVPVSVAVGKYVQQAIDPYVHVYIANRIIFSVVMMVICLAAAAASFYLVEAHFLRLKRFFPSHASRRPGTLVVPAIAYNAPGAASSTGQVNL